MRKLPHMTVDPTRPGVVLFDGDPMTGMIVGMRAADVAAACNSSAQQAARIAELEATIRSIRDKVHAHNRGGELYAGLRDVIRDMCDRALSWK